MKISSGDTTKLFLATALFLAASPVQSRANPVSSNPQKRKWYGSAHDSLCSDVMCIECEVNGATARYVLRSTGLQRLGWMAIGFGRNMADSPMVIVWPSYDADGAFGSVTLSQRKSPWEIMPTPDPKPPFAAKLSLSDTSVTGEHPQIGFTRRAPKDGMQNIIWAFSRTPPGSADADAHISIHQRIGRGMLNLTRTVPTPVEPVPPALPPSTPAESSGSDTTAGHGGIDEKAKGERESETNGGSERPGRGGFASLMHGAFCMAGFLLVIPAGVLVVRYAKMTGSPRAFELHRLLQLHLAGGFIAGGTLAYLFTDNDASGGVVAHRAGSANLLLLYLVQCAYGSWVYRIPWQSRTRMHRVLLAGLGATIVLLAVYQTWLGLVAAGHDTPVWLTLLFSVFSLYVFGVVMVKRRFGSVQVAEMGEGPALDTRTPNDELADGGEKL
ncbi:hypothetical protein EDB92DRAFT_1854186 [Lactarius akahatsu]|uniref:Cytochrome b561 domain-containing protein n=1 Tax=Lactarius akahatsu TaxID=416441 RepID=A0AAD4QER8_9AGAM|nr:hypothetical protein EDB92DRAFT_1854186 [Lactarius akahatsu]